MKTFKEYLEEAEAQIVKKMRDQRKALGMKKFVKVHDDGSHHGVATSNKEKWKKLKAKGYKLEEVNKDT